MFDAGQCPHPYTQVCRGLGASGSAGLILTISGHVSVVRSPMELISTLEACAPRLKPFSSSNANAQGEWK